MSTARLLAYGIGGLILGLVLENSALRLSSRGGRQVRRIKQKAKDALDGALSSR